MLAVRLNTEKVVVKFGVGLIELHSPPSVPFKHRYIP